MEATHTISVHTTVCVTMEVVGDMTPEAATKVAQSSLRSVGGNRVVNYSADYDGPDLDSVEVRVVEAWPWDGTADFHHGFIFAHPSEGGE